jgi:murein L,D-transpeptidase YafK
MCTVTFSDYATSVRLFRMMSDSNREQVSSNGSVQVVVILLAALLVPSSYNPVVASEFPIADKVLVEKGKRQLHLLKNNQPFRTFPIALGSVPEGDKEREGDQKTPEGQYYLDLRNSDSDFFLSIRVSYPNSTDRATARQKGMDPGGQIMIHGQPNVPIYSKSYYSTEDWTNGCIAVSNSDMIDIWLMTPKNVPIEIVP